MTRVLSFTRTIQIPIPEGATHYSLLDDEVAFHKCRMIGAAGEHWFYLNIQGVWHFSGHSKSHWVHELPEDLTLPMPDSWITFDSVGRGTTALGPRRLAPRGPSYDACQRLTASSSP